MEAFHDYKNAQKTQNQCQVLLPIGGEKGGVNPSLNLIQSLIAL